MTSRPILIVDDDPAVCEIVRQTLTLEGFAVIAVKDGQAGVRAWEQYDPQLIILDILMPKMSGLQALKHIRQRGDTPVMMLTRKTSEDDKVQAFELGADDYLSKPFSTRELTARVKAVLRRTRNGAPVEAPTHLIAGELRLDLANRRVTIGDRTILLSRTEFQILTELARKPGQVFSPDQLQAAVWGPEYGSDLQILRCAIYRLRQKIEPDTGEPRHILAQREAGYWLAVPDKADA